MGFFTIIMCIIFSKTYVSRSVCVVCFVEYNVEEKVLLVSRHLNHKKENSFSVDKECVETKVLI